MSELPDHVSYHDNPEFYDEAIARTIGEEVLENDIEDPFKILDPEDKQQVLEDDKVQMEIIAQEEYGSSYGDLDKEKQNQVETQYMNSILHSNGIGSASADVVDAIGTASD